MRHELQLTTPPCIANEPQTSSACTCDDVGDQLSFAFSDDMSTIITGSQNIFDHLDVLTAGIKYEIATISPGGAFTGVVLAENRKRNTELLSRDIQSRTIYLDSVRNDKEARSYVEWLNSLGSQVRTAPVLPIRLIVIDKKIAILPANMTNGMESIVIYQRPSTVLALQNLFEKTWQAAKPLGTIFTGPGERLTDNELAILELLVSGKTDREIATKFQTSPQTVRRNIDKLEKRVGANSRYQLIYKAAKAGLI